MNRAVAVATAFVAVTATAAGQAPPAAPRPQFRSSVDTVPLDVSVLDRNRRPVRDLTPADFTILEDGKPQEISIFQAVDIPDVEPPSTPWIREVAPDVATNEGLQERRLFLIVMDDATIQASLPALTTARDVARKFIDRLGPSDLAAVIFTRGTQNAQDYTSDRTRLLAAIDKFSAGFRDLGLFDADTQKPIAGEDDLFFMWSVGVLDRATEILSSLPDRRKAIVYIGQGVPVNLDNLAPQSPGLNASGGSSAIMSQVTAGIFKDRMSRVFQRAQRANVNVYTLDVCGLRVPPAVVPVGTARGVPPTCEPGLEIDYLKTLAANTGGRSVVETNDFDPGVQAIFQENASYYLLGYRPSDPKKDGSFHRLEVRVNRRDVEVRTRSGYQTEKASDARKRTAATAASPLGAALAGVLPKSDLPMTLATAVMAKPGRRESTVAVVVGVRQPIRQTAGQVVEHVDLQVSAYNVDGKLFDSRRLLADVKIRAGASGLAEYEVLSQLELNPGRYQLRVAGNVGSLSTSGSLYYDLDVPDVSKAPVSLTGIVLSALPGPVVATQAGLQPILPITPTTRRTFAPGDRVTAFARVHQGGKAPVRGVPVRVQVTDDRGAVVLNRLQDLAADRFTAARSADIKFDVPVANLATGEYLLTLEADSSGDAIRRQIRFRVAR